MIWQNYCTIASVGTLPKGHGEITYVNALLKAHKVWFRYLWQEDYTKNNGTECVRNMCRPKVVIETFTESGIKKLLNYYSGSNDHSVRNKTISMLLPDTGIQFNKLIEMHPEDVSVDDIVYNDASLRYSYVGGDKYVSSIR